MNELLSASSVFLAALGLLHASWYQEIRDAILAKMPEQKDDRGGVQSALSAALFSRALPLLVASMLFGATILPKWISVCARTWAAWVGGSYDYDPIATLFSLVFVVTLGFATHMFVLVRDLVLRVRVASRD